MRVTVGSRLTTGNVEHQAPDVVPGIYRRSDGTVGRFVYPSDVPQS